MMNKIIICLILIVSISLINNVNALQDEGFHTFVAIVEMGFKHSY